MNGIYLRGGNWYLDFTFHRKRIRQMYGPSRKGAAQAISKIKADIAENKYLDKRKDPAPMKFYDFAKEYLDWRGRERRRLSLMRKLDNEFGSKKIQEITAWHIEKYKAKRKEEVKPASVNREIALLKHMFTKAMEWGKLKDNPTKSVKLLKGEVKRVRYLMPDEVARFLSCCSNHLRPIVTIAVHTGMRKSEILNLTWDRVDFRGGFIVLLQTKNSERRDVPMNETARAVLEGLEKKGERVFPFKDVKTAFRSAVKKAGLEDFRFHDLRHTFASNLVMSGVDLNTVRELLGQKTLAMTLRYSHLAPNYKTRAVSVLDSMPSQIPPRRESEQKVVSITGLNHYQMPT